MVDDDLYVAGGHISIRDKIDGNLIVLVAESMPEAPGQGHPEQPVRSVESEKALRNY